ncbi:MAG TPA: ATP-binding cassette domain-containing protein [Candidatus Baltobacteraceae bacterium]|jgi:ABC-type sugar transport system ATPase subunit|nr:ATP-binding cassette domain-containing protein [Candidatus Baltobacteraceae bacterium]
MSAAVSMQAAIEAKRISKRYGKVVALEDVDFEAYPGEIVAVIGDNGAGKSTLIKILSGAVIPDSGSMAIAGQSRSFSGPRDAQRVGIETVYQDLALAPDLDIAANLFLGREPVRKGFFGALDFFDSSAMRLQAEEHLRDFGIKVSKIEQTVDTLSGGQRQAIAVARSVLWGKSVVIMDEPTAALGVAQSSLVLDLMRRVRSKGIAVIFISHNLPHVFETADRIVVLRHGRRVGSLDPKTSTMDQAVSLMTGASVDTAPGGS